MIVFSDTTPLISLMKIGHLDLVQKLFGKVVIPASVFAELTANPRLAAEARMIRDAGYIDVAESLDASAIETFGMAVGLDKGESETILLGRIRSADLVLMDEAKGRQVAHQMNMNIMGTIGILTVAFRKGLLTGAEVKESVDVLRNSRRHISETLYRALIDGIS